MSKQIILCIDDEAIVLDALKEQLYNVFNEDIEIEVAESGNEALEIVEELISDNYKVPVVIADFIMPNMKGDELLAEIHNQMPETRTIMLTGQASIEGVGNAINRANLYRYISKPWDKEDLVLTVKEAIKSYEKDDIIIHQNEELKELNAGLEEKVSLRTKELQDLNTTKDKFFSIIAHDLKNPFNTLMGFSELLTENFDSFSTEKIKEYIGIIFDTSKNSYALLENLLEWSRSQTGRIQVTPEKFNLYKIVNENISLLESQATKKQINLRNILSETLEAFADENMINTVIRNLISNAIKYTPIEGSIQIESKTKENAVILTITDSGVGISEENIPKLFRLDQNYSTNGTANETGTGLGLILCAEFIAKNKGKIWVESELNKGSSFSIQLPVI